MMNFNLMKRETEIVRKDNGRVGAKQKLRGTNTRHFIVGNGGRASYWKVPMQCPLDLLRWID
jgi:hypothetical protein